MHHNKLQVQLQLKPSNQRSQIYKTIVLSNENLDSVLIVIDFYFINLKQNQYNKAMITTISQYLSICFLKKNLEISPRTWATTIWYLFIFFMNHVWYSKQI